MNYFDFALNLPGFWTFNLHCPFLFAWVSIPAKHLSESRDEMEVGLMHYGRLKGMD